MNPLYSGECVTAFVYNSPEVQADCLIDFQTLVFSGSHQVLLTLWTKTNSNSLLDMNLDIFYSDMERVLSIYLKEHLKTLW